MCGVVKVYRHLHERVTWQYGYVQHIPRHPTDVVELWPGQIVQAFLDFRTHTIKEPDWGEPTGVETWRMGDGYVRWYTRVSHPQILPLLPRDIMRPTNEEQIIAQQWEQNEGRGSPILMTWLVALLPMLMSSWVRRWWALSSGLRPCAMLGSRSHRFWPEGEANGRGGGSNSISKTRSNNIFCLG